MKLHWIIPLTVDATFQFTSKNEMARSFKALGHSITTSVGYIETRTPMDGFSEVEYIHTPRGSVLSRLLFHWQMLKSTWQSGADVVMFGFQAAHLIPLAWLFRFGRSRPKLIMDIRTVPVDVKSGLKGKIELWRYKLSLHIANWFCDGITVITPMLGETAKPYLLRHKDRMGVWTSGVHLEHFDRTGDDMRAELNLQDKRVLLYHGVLSPNRGLQNALHAFKELSSDYPDLVFLFVGDGEGRDELQALSKELGVEDRVVFTGKVPYEKVSSYIRTANLSILPFPNITWWAVSSPIKLMEYLATGIPIVATDIDAHRWVLSQTGGGVIARDDRPESLMESIREALDEGIEQADLDVLESTISWNKQAKSLAEYVDRL